MTNRQHFKNMLLSKRLTQVVDQQWKVGRPTLHVGEGIIHASATNKRCFNSLKLYQLTQPVANSIP